MKRILALLLVLAMAFGLFAGCGKQTPDVTTEPTQTTVVETQPDTQLEKAIEYLRTFYKNAAEKTAMDYTRLGTVRIGITPYEVVWSVDVTEDVLKIVKNEDGTYTIDINEEAIKESTEPTPYVLTATITGKDGRQLSISWNHFVPAAIDQDAIDVIKQAYQLASGETMEGTFTVTGVIKTIDTLYDPSYKNVTVTIEVAGAEDMPIKCYRLKGDGADKLAVGDTITVTGSFMNYNGQVQFAQGCILDAVESGGAAAPVAPEDPKQILREAYALAPGASLPYYCYLTGTITFVDQAYDPTYSNVTVTISTNGYTIKCYRMKGDGADQLNINDVITVGGVITNYNGTIEFGAGCSLTNLVNKEPPAAIADPTPESHVSVKDAYAIGRGKDHNTYTEGKYYVTGTIVSIENDIYGNLHIADGNGNKLMIYGSYSEDGKTRFGDLPTKPTVGQTITVYGAIGRFNSNPQIKNAWIMGVKGTTPVIPDAPSIEQVTEIKAGTPYRFGMAQGNLENAVYYLAGGMNGFYMETTADPAAAINVYVEETAGGYYFYTLSGENKLYINMVVSADGEHVNGAYEATASTVYTYDAAKNTLTATVGGAEYWFGTRNDKTYTTMGPCAVEYAGFFGQFYVGSDEAPNPDEPEDPDAPTGLEEGVAYTISAVNGKGTLWFNGTVSGGRFGGTYTETDAVSVYAENVEGGFLLYFLDGETKQYICIADSTTGGSFGTDATTATIFEWNANKATAAVAEDGNNRGFGVGATSTFDTFSAYDLTGTYNWGQFTAVGGSTDPDEPTCEHLNTTVEGAVEATCTAEGHTGKTVCSDCGETVSEGEVIPVLDHSYVDGTCSVCGKTESSEPAVPAEPTVATSLTAGTAYKLGLFSTNKNATYYFTGAMSGYYGATETAYETAIDVFVEEVEGGYHLYFVDTNGAKQYISLVASGSYRNFVFGDAAQSVFTWDAEKTALYTTVEGGVCYIGTFGTYVTMGVLQESMLKDSDYIARLYTLASSEPDVPGTCQHNSTVLQGASEKTCTVHGYTGDVVCLICGEIIEKGTFIPALGHSFANGTCGVCGEADPDYTPDEPEEPTTGLKEGVAYTISAANKTDMLWFNGTITNGRFNGSINKDDAVSVYAENVEGGFLLYFLDGEVKTYICMDDKAAGGRFGTDAATATVYEWNADKNTAAVAEDSNNRAFGCDPTKTYTNFSAYDLSNGSTYNWGQFTEVEGGSTEPDVPACQHVNTELQGKVDATCTVDGYTGDTKCADCGETVATGEVIPATGHSFANGTCGVCGAADPNYTPNVPEEPAVGLKEGVAYTISAVNGKGTLWFNGTISSGRFNGGYSENEAVYVYAENVDGGFLLYFLDGEVKTYICMDDKAAGGRFGTDAATATVFEWNADKNTAAVAEDSNNRAFGVQATSTYDNFSAYDLTNAGYNWGQYTAVGGSTEPECKHTNTKVEGAKDATCTTDGYTGDTVCTDCGEVLHKGETSAALGHPFVDGICPKCGEADPNYVPLEPEAIGKAYKFYLDRGEKWYFAGSMGYSSLTTTDNMNAATDVYLEEVEGGFRFYFMDGETKTYIDIYEYETGKARVRLTTEPTAVFIFNKDLGIYQTAIYTAYVAGAHRFLGASGLGNTIEALDVKYITGENIGDLGLRYFITSFVEVAGEEPALEHVIENGGGYAASLSEDGTQLDCFQFGNEGAIFYANYFTEKPAEGYYEIREYNGNFYYTSAPSWGVIPYESITISGMTAQLKMYDDEAMVELELIAANQYKVITGNGNLSAGLVFTFGAEYCEVLGHLGVRNCEENVKCSRCETVICGPTGHEYGEDGVCFRCFSAMRPEEPEQTGLVVGKAYKFGMIQENVSTTDVYYLAGGMSGYYMATTTDASAAIDVYVEETEGGYYFYTYISGAKTYINMVVSGTHVNGAYEATASTVYTYDAENKTLIAIVNGDKYWFGTRSDKSYTTVGPCATSYNGFFCLFY